MFYICPKGHQSTDPDYCSECGALIGLSKVSNKEQIMQAASIKPTASNSNQDICPDCGTLREGNARFCEVCRHDFQENKAGVAEVIVESQKSEGEHENKVSNITSNIENTVLPKTVNMEEIKEAAVLQKLDVVITVDKDRASSWEGESTIKPDTMDRVFPLDLDENLVGRYSKNKGIYPEIEISDPGVSHRHLKFIRQEEGSFSVLELGSVNGTELNGKFLEPGLAAAVKPGDELTIGIWTRLKIVSRGGVK